MLEDPLFYAVAIPAVLLVGISKAGFGGGVGLLGVPAMALVISPVTAAAILLPILCAMDALTLYALRGRVSPIHLKALLPGALAGIALGAVFIRAVTADEIRLVIGVLALAFVAQFAWKAVRGADAGPPASAHGGPALATGLFWGTLSGFSSFLAHAGGPPMNVHLIPQRLERTVFVGTAAVFFAVMNLVKLVPYTALSLFSAETLLTSLVLLPVVPAGIWLGLRLAGRVSEVWFYRICVAALAVTGTRLTWDGLT